MICQEKFIKVHARIHVTVGGQCKCDFTGYAVKIFKEHSFLLLLETAVTYG
jgi:hypothetical protein